MFCGNAVIEKIIEESKSIRSKLLKSMSKLKNIYSALVIFISLISVTISNEEYYKLFRRKFYVAKMKNQMIEAVYLEKDNKREMIDCYIYGDRDIIEFLLKNVADIFIVYISDTSIKNFINFCDSAKINEVLPFDHLITMKHMLGSILGMFIYPGTKWCGAGNISKNYDDLGTEIKADKCCRSHDYCNDMMGPFSKKHGLINASPFAESHCQCDDEFRNCLRDANTKTSNRLGVIYFNVLRMKCFKKDYPIISCLKQEGIFPFRSCVEYKLDESKDQKWQFFANKRFKPKMKYAISYKEKIQELQWTQYYEKLNSQTLGNNSPYCGSLLTDMMKFWS